MAIMKIIFACALATAGVALASAEQLARTIGDSDLSGSGSTSDSANAPRPARSIGDYVAGYNAANPNDSKRENFGRQNDINSYEHAEGMRERAESMRERAESMRERAESMRERAEGVRGDFR
jgi:hypothetical protein